MTEICSHLFCFHPEDQTKGIILLHAGSLYFFKKNKHVAEKNSDIFMPEVTSVVLTSHTFPPYNPFILQYSFCWRPEGQIQNPCSMPIFLFSLMGAIISRFQFVGRRGEV